MNANETLKESTGVFNNALAVKGAYSLRWHAGLVPTQACQLLPPRPVPDPESLVVRDR